MGYYLMEQTSVTLPNEGVKGLVIFVKGMLKVSYASWIALLLIDNIELYNL